MLTSPSPLILASAGDVHKGHSQGMLCSDRGLDYLEVVLAKGEMNAGRLVGGRQCRSCCMGRHNGRTG